MPIPLPCAPVLQRPPQARAGGSWRATPPDGSVLAMPFVGRNGWCSLNLLGEGNERLGRCGRRRLQQQVRPIELDHLHVGSRLADEGDTAWSDQPIPACRKVQHRHAAPLQFRSHIHSGDGPNSSCQYGGANERQRFVEQLLQSVRGVPSKQHASA